MTKMLIDRSTVEQALEALEVATNCLDAYYIPRGKTTLPEIEDAITALKAALAEPVQEPATLPGPGLVMCPACCAQFDPALNSVQPVQEPLQSAAIHAAWSAGYVEGEKAAWSAQPQDQVAQISANRAIAAIEEWKSLWWKVPPFASKVNRVTREAITVSHNPLFALLLDAQAAKQMPKGCTTPSGCQQHGCHGECLPTEPQRPAEPVQEPQGCDHCNHPLYAATKCRVCGRVTEPVQEPKPVAWRFEARHIDSAWAAAVTLKHPGPEGIYMRNVMPLYAHPPQRLPLTDEEIERLWYPSAVIAEPGKRRVAFGRAVERAHGIGGEG